MECNGGVFIIWCGTSKRPAVRWSDLLDGWVNLISDNFLGGEFLNKWKHRQIRPDAVGRIVESGKLSATTEEREIACRSDVTVDTPVPNQLRKLRTGDAPLADDRRRAIRELLQQTAEKYGVTCRTH